MNTSIFMDIHTHILPEVDDGASTMEVTRKMLLQAKEQGIKTIIATPHYGTGKREKNPLQLKEVLGQVQKEADELSAGIKLYLGNELYYREAILEAVVRGEALTLAESRYVLIEFSVGVKYNTLYQGLREFVLAGYAPILAHVERYQCLMEDEELIQEIRELGVYIQMNADSLLGSFLNKRTAQHRRLIKNQLIHFIATDCHNNDTRAPKMQKAYQIVEKLTDPQYTKELFLANPGKIIENKYL